MKLQIGIIVDRKIGFVEPLYKEVSEEEYKEAHENLIRRATANFYDVVIAELERRMKNKIEEEEK